MNLSFIIVNYQSEKYLKNCLSSIKEKILNLNYEIIVVNNSGIRLEVEPPGEVRVMNTGKNVGFGAANNIGTKEAKGEILCFLNPDTEIISSNINDLLGEFGKDDKLAIIGPRLLTGDNEVQQWSAGAEVTLWDIVLNNFGIKRSKKIWESPGKIGCAWVSGAAMFIQKEVFEKIGGFDENFFMYFEDIDLCKRVRLAGYKVLYFPEFTIKHFGGKSFGIDKKKQKRYYRKSQWRYFKKYALRI
jgi:GT2 family glycosyltransferase